MNKNIFYHYFEHWGMVDVSMQLWMTLCAPSILGRCHQFGLPGLVFMLLGLLGSVFYSKKKNYMY